MKSDKFTIIYYSLVVVDAIQDSVYVLAAAIKEMMRNETITEAPKDCDDSGAIWESGKRMFHYLISQNIRGETGQVAFDASGDRMFAEYAVINTRENQRKKVVGKYFYDMVSCRLTNEIFRVAFMIFFQRIHRRSVRCICTSTTV